MGSLLHGKAAEQGDLDLKQMIKFYIKLSFTAFMAT